MPRFKHYNYDQDAMVVINYQEQLQPGESPQRQRAAGLLYPGNQASPDLYRLGEAPGG